MAYKPKPYERQYADFLGGKVHQDTAAYTIRQGDALTRDAATGGLKLFTADGQKFVGFSSAEVYVPAADAPVLSPNINCEYARRFAIPCLPADSVTFTAADTGIDVFAVNETQIAKTGNAASKCGVLVRVDANGMLWVDPTVVAK